MTAYRYAPRDLGAEWLRVALGFASTVVLMAAAGDSLIVVVICIGFLALILVYVIDLVLRHHTEITLSDTGIELSSVVAAIYKRPLRARHIAWRDLSELRLRFFPTRRDRERGWFELVLKGAGATIKVQSSLIDFSLFVVEVFRRAREVGVPISSTSEHNFGYFTRQRMEQSR